MIRKDITFIYKDEVQKQVYEMIAEEARKRGYETRITDNEFARCEIGWYCEHVNFPQYSRFSVIMLHDIIQQYGYWPDLWIREPWNRFDIGFLPSRIWSDNWDQCSQYYYANPRKGVYLTGWPKADRLSAFMDPGKKEAYIREVGIDPAKPTVLYAPAWENDGKQDDFVRAMLPLDVNIVIKQFPWPESYPDQIRNIAEMRELHKNHPRVLLLDPHTNILDAIMISDILVSEESSTMCESVMMGKPAVSVCNWLIPDTTPSRFPSDDYDYAVRTTKEELTKCVESILQDYDTYAQKAKRYSEEHFANLGHCIPMMLDILDAAIEGKEGLHAPLKPAERKRIPFGQMKFHLAETARRKVCYDYGDQRKAVAALCRAAIAIKRAIAGKEQERDQTND